MKHLLHRMARAVFVIEMVNDYCEAADIVLDAGCSRRTWQKCERELVFNDANHTTMTSNTSRLPILSLSFCPLSPLACPSFRPSQSQ